MEIQRSLLPCACCESQHEDDEATDVQEWIVAENADRQIYMASDPAHITGAPHHWIVRAIAATAVGQIVTRICPGCVSTIRQRAEDEAIRRTLDSQRRAETTGRKARLVCIISGALVLAMIAFLAHQVLNGAEDGGVGLFMAAFFALLIVSIVSGLIWTLNTKEEVNAAGLEAAERRRTHRGQIEQYILSSEALNCAELLTEPVSSNLMCRYYVLDAKSCQPMDASKHVWVYDLRLHRDDGISSPTDVACTIDQYGWYVRHWKEMDIGEYLLQKPITAAQLMEYRKERGQLVPLAPALRDSYEKRHIEVNGKTKLYLTAPLPASSTIIQVSVDEVHSVSLGDGTFGVISLSPGPHRLIARIGSKKSDAYDISTADMATLRVDVLYTMLDKRPYFRSVPGESAKNLVASLASLRLVSMDPA